MKIRDVRCEETFIEDWQKVKEFYPDIANRLDRKIYMTLLTGVLPKSFQQHGAHNTETDVYIGYVSVGRQGWRLLFNVDEYGTMILMRLIPHDKERRVLATT